MKTLVTSISIFLLAFFILIPAHGRAAAEENPAQQDEPKEALKEAEPQDAVDANAATEPNAIRARIEKFEGLDKALEQIDENSRDEIREWTRRTDDRLDLILETQKQITAELNFMRGLAIKEGAVKTTAAIDGILLDRQERFKDVIEKLEKQREKQQRRKEMEERKAKSRERDRDHSRERPSRTR